MLTERGQLWLDLIGTLFFLIPACLLLAICRWPFFMQAYEVSEISSNAGGLLRWPIKLVLPVGFVLLALQGVSEVIKRIASLQGLCRRSMRNTRGRRNDDHAGNDAAADVRRPGSSC